MGDVVVVQGDPLSDITILTDTDNVALVLQAGAVVERTTE